MPADNVAQVMWRTITAAIWLGLTDLLNVRLESAVYAELNVLGLVKSNNGSAYVLRKNGSLHAYASFINAQRHTWSLLCTFLGSDILVRTAYES